jgi:hypothetical protein
VKGTFVEKVLGTTKTLEELEELLISGKKANKHVNYESIAASVADYGNAIAPLPNEYRNMKTDKKEKTKLKKEAKLKQKAEKVKARNKKAFIASRKKALKRVKPVIGEPAVIEEPAVKKAKKLDKPVGKLPAPEVKPAVKKVKKSDKPVGEEPAPEIKPAVKKVKKPVGEEPAPEIKPVVKKVDVKLELEPYLLLKGDSHQVVRKRAHSRVYDYERARCSKLGLTNEQGLVRARKVSHNAIKLWESLVQP